MINALATERVEPKGSTSQRQWMLDPPGGAANHNFPRLFFSIKHIAEAALATYPAGSRLVEVNDGVTHDDADPPIPKPNPPAATATSICRTAADLVGGSRQSTHGDKRANFTATATLWNAYLLAARGVCAGLNPLDICALLELLKIARRLSGTHNLDDYIDSAGYAACAGELADADAKEPMRVRPTDS